MPAVVSRVSLLRHLTTKSYSTFIIPLRDAPDKHPGFLLWHMISIFDVMPLPTLYITKQIVLLCFWGDWRDSNPRPSEPQSDVLPTELQPHGGEGGIRTHARYYPSTPLAGEPLLATWVPRQIVMKKWWQEKQAF